MKFNWTTAQGKAVSAPVSDILVTAAAGSGKTQVLTGRIIERIIGGADITRLLVVTFTNAAAAEMRTRIAENLSAALRDNPQNNHIREQLACLSGAHITTMHSFCMDIIKRNFYLADLNAGFRIADDAEASLLLMESADEAIEELCHQADRDFLTFADSFSSVRSDNILSELAISMYKFADSMPYPKQWISKQPQSYKMTTGAEFKKSLICETLLLAAEEKLLEAKGVLAAAKEFCAAENCLSEYSLMFSNDIECVSALIKSADDYDRLHASLSDFSFTRRVSAKDAPIELKTQLDKMRDRARKLISDLFAKNFRFSSDENARIMNDALPIVKGAVTLVLKIMEIFTEKKRKRNILDYSDMEHIAVSLLDDNGKPSEVAVDIRKSFDEIYIDEYQDTSETQELVFGLISGRIENCPNVFMVGDLKQSIYGFRQSSPALFAEKKKTYKSDGDKYIKIALTKNFRSSKPIIDFVNHIFSNLMNNSIGGVDYDSEEQLVKGTDYPDISHPIEVAVIRVDEKNVPEEYDEDYAQDLSSIEAEALYISMKIKDMVGKEYVYDAKRNVSRIMKYSDIAIISRSVKTAAPLIEDVLTSENIPVYCDSSGGYFETSEIKGMLALLSTIDNPRNDIPLISALRIPTIGFDEDMLATIRIYDKRGDFYDALKMCAESGTSEAEKCSIFLDRLNRWRFLSEHLPCDELIELLYDETGYMDFALAMPGGELRAANLRLLTERARAFEKTSFRGLFNFINFIDKMREKSDSGSAKIIGEGHDVVRVMSIHKSKGLEFPVVILIGCGKSFNRRDESEKLTFHKKLGTGADFVDTTLRCSYPTPAKAAVAAANRADSVSEELRVLYVALTRAKERLIITATTKNPMSTVMSWRIGASLASAGGFGAAKSFLDWIGACLITANCPGLSQYCDRENGKGTEILFDFHPICMPNTVAEHIEKNEEESIDTDELLSGIYYSYPHKNLSSIPSKISVSEMKSLLREEGDADEHIYNPFALAPIKKPRFIRDKDELSATEKGSLIHLIMQTLPLPVNAIDDIKNHVSSLFERGIITKKMTESVPWEKIFAFFDSSLGKRMMASDKVVREKPFTDNISASLITKNPQDSKEKILVQGIIDCYFFENDQIILIDYKTDKVSDKALILEKYRVQAEAYASFLERKYSKECKKYIYLFDIDDIIEII